MRNLLKASLVVALALGLAVMMAPRAWAFHDQGVAHCNGCHTMHNSQDGALVDPDSPDGNPWLLKAATPSDTCLGCHATGLGAIFSVDPLNPSPLKGAGNFIFLLEDNLNDGHAGGANPIPGDAAGHNLDAPGHGLAPDATLSSAPGGTFPSSVLNCSSCHDPHGNAQFRMLNGVGPVGPVTFLNPAPDAVGLSIFFGSESPTSHTAYKSGMSAWCSNCHADFHDEAGGRLEHPSGSTLGGTIAGNYNLYNGTSDQAGGVQATAYLAEVPFQDTGSNTTTSSTAGPSANSQVMCLTCHRAHGSSAPDAGRWDFSVTYLHEDGVESGSYAIPDPYSDLNQRSLCNKCHNQDVGDEMPF